MLIVEDESPGLRVIQTEAYRNLIEKSPGLIHENCGDFYSKVHVDRLPEAVSKALDKNFMGPKLNQDLVIVDASTFNPEFAEIEKDYLVREVDGIRIYSPKLHTPEATNVSQTYSLFGIIAVEDLFADGPKGTLQVSLENFFEEINLLTGFPKIRV